MCWYSITPRTIPLNGTKFSVDSGDILDGSSNCNFFDTLDWSENQEAAAQQPQLICYDTENGCESSSSFLLHSTEVNQSQLVASLVSSAAPSSTAYGLLDLQDLETTKSTHNHTQAILEEFSLLFSSSSSGVSNAPKNANLPACTKETTLENAITIKTTRRVKPDRSKEASENSHTSNYEKKKDVHDSFEELLFLQIQNWVNGKEGNIRALLASLNDVLWKGAGQWPHHRIADLLSENQVKKCYHRACLLVHPDKHVGQEHEELARAIFTELNEAWNVFVQKSPC